MTKRRLLIGVLLFAFGLGYTAANDVATFMNLGFSNDSRFFAFAEYGISAADDRSFSNLFVVDVAANEFAPSGRANYRSNRVVSLGDDGRGAVFNAYNRAIETIRTRRIDATLQGRIIYLLINSDESKSHIDFRDFVTGNRYSVDLIQSKRTASAAFHIALRVDSAGGTSRNYSVGRQGYFRPNVEQYRIVRIVLAPDERSVVFVVEKSGGEAISYMVETLKLR